MRAIVRARFADGVLTPLEPLHLDEGAEVTLTVDGEAAASDGAASDGAAAAVSDSASPQTNAGESILEMFERIRNSAPPDAWDNMPTDGAKNYKHYLYGHPRVED